MVLGNLAAIVQSSVRRLLAYSAIAQAGYMLLGILAGGQEGMAALVFYASTYGLAALGAFAVLAIAGAGDRFADFAGFSRRSPLLAWSMLVFLLSLAGIPPLIGFASKYNLFIKALETGNNVPLVIVAVIGSMVSLYYYFRAVMVIYSNQDEATEVNFGSGYRPQIIIALVLLVISSLVPIWLVNLI